MPFSTGTPAAGISAPLVDAGRGSEADFERLGERVGNAFVLIETDELQDVSGLFAEYASASEIEPRAVARGAAGVVYVGSRSRNVLYRHNASAGPRTDRPMLVMERDAGLRALRLIRDGRALELWVTLELERGPTYESENVIGEIRGSENPEEIVVIGAHLDSWDLGTGALDNGCNVALVIDVARQISRLGLRPRRTIRFALFNGEEQGMNGSWGYVKTHRDELDQHVMASSYDIGSGRITGFFTGGRPQLVAKVASALTAVRDLGPFQHVDAPIVGTDNFDFMMEGIANLVANQDSANYGPNYHARTDTFDAVDQRQLRLNAAIAAAVTWGFAEMEFDWPRQSREQIEALIAGTDLQAQMSMMGLWDPWKRGERGRGRE
jgi:Iap family predicted aminopeptidase